MVTTIIFILILALLVLIHEFGHFIAAKKNGVLVEEFGFGFPPRVWGKKIGETLYSINLFPIGGFVKVYGEEYHEANINVDPKLAKRAFVNKKPWQKAMIILAGVFMNVLLAVAIYYVLLGTNNFKSDPFTLFGDYKFRFGTQQEQVVVANIVKKSPADQAGVEIGDVVQRIQPAGENWVTVASAAEMIKYITSAQGKNLTIDLINIKNNKMKTIIVTPKYNPQLKRALIGVGLAQSVILSYDGPLQRLTAGFLHSYNIMSYSMNTMGFFISSSFKQRSLGPVSETVSGPVGIFNVVSDIVQFSGSKLFINLAQLMALLSLSLASINVMPFPALDGGRLVFVLYEWISGKRPNQRVEQYVNMAGFVTLIALAIVISVNDVIRLFR